jgi:hypothetical protein
MDTNGHEFPEKEATTDCTDNTGHKDAAATEVRSRETHE